MATVSFDTEFSLQEKYADSFFEAIENTENRNVSLKNVNPISNNEIERSEQILKNYFCP